MCPTPIIDDRDRPARPTFRDHPGPCTQAAAPGEPLHFAANALTTIRAANWWDYKIPPLLAVAYAGLVVFGVAEGGIVRVAEALITVLAVAAYGFVLNDLTDIEADRLSGQPNRMAGRTVPVRLVALLLPLGAAIGFAVWSRDPVTQVLTVTNLLLPTLYSVPPVRLKGRGVLGALADTSGVHLVPMALVAWAVTRGAPEHADLVPAFIASAMSWTAMVGLRGIVVHQAQGLAGDRAASVKTFVASIGRDRARRLVWRWIVPGEVLSLMVFLAIVLPHAPVLIVTLLVFVLVEARQVQLGWTMPLFDPPVRSTERYRPLVNNAWYELWLPLGLAVQLALSHPWGWGVVALHLLLFRVNLVSRVRALLPILNAPLFPRTRRGSGFETHLPRGPVDGATLAGTRVFVTTPVWTAGGLTHWAGDVVRGLRRAGVEASVVLTEEHTPLVTIGEPRMTRPGDISVIELPVERADNWGLRWATLGRLLENAAPSVLLLTNDWRHSAIVPLLGEQVTVVGVVHAVDPLYDEQVLRLRDSWDLLVGGGAEVSKHLQRLVPELSERIVTIPHGVNVPAELPKDGSRRDALPRLLVIGKPMPGAPVGLQRMLADSEARGRPWRLTVLDPDDELAELCRMRPVSVVRIPNREEWGTLIGSHHAVLALDWHPDRRRQLVEAMGHGAVPLVWGETPHDAPFRPGVSGRSLENGDPVALAELAAMLGDSSRWQQKSARAREETLGRHYSVDQMVDAFVDRIAWARSRPHRARGRTGVRLAPPPAVVGDQRIFGGEFTVTTEWGAFPDQWNAEEFHRVWTARGNGSTPQ